MSEKKKDTRRKWWGPPVPAPKKKPAEAQKDELKAALDRLREVVKAYYG